MLVLIRNSRNNWIRGPSFKNKHHSTTICSEGRCCSFWEKRIPNIAAATFSSRTLSSSSNNDNNNYYDVFIVGGGVAGSTVAKLLKDQSRIPLRIGLLDTAKEPFPLTSFSSSSGDEETTGGKQYYPATRAYAMSPTSLHLLGIQKGGVVDRIRQIGRASDYDKMQVWDSGGPGNLRFTYKDLSNHSNKQISSQKILGSMLEDATLVSALWDELRGASSKSKCDIDLFSSSTITGIETRNTNTTSNKTDKKTSGVEVTFESKNPDEIKRTILTKLLVGADGANSYVRQAFHIPTMGFDYGRTAVTTTVALTPNHQSNRRNNTMQRTAFQRFLPAGPVALLPMWQQGDYANVVWSTTPEHAKLLVSMSSDEFINELNGVLQQGPLNSPPFLDQEFSSKLPHWIQNVAYGVDMVGRTIGEGLAMARWNTDPFQIPPLVESVVGGGGKRFAFPLKLQQARSYVKPHVALVGDAAHTIHPMAGQGLNLGLSDVSCLIRHMMEAQDCGMNFGDTYFLDRYNKERQQAAIKMMTGIQWLHTMFSMESTPAVWARNVGVNVTNSMTPIRQKLAHIAAGDIEEHSAKSYHTKSSPLR